MHNRSDQALMPRMRTFLRDRLPESLLEALRKPRRAFGKRASKYDSYARYHSYAAVKLTDEDIRRGAYKQYIGGAGRNDGDWDLRGAFQLHLLQTMGMTGSSKLLDVGCGPGRASRFLIDFLDAGNYCGVDYNPDFIRAVKTISKENGLDVKQPAFEVVRNFDFEHMQPVFDYALVFSVLNHCNSKNKLAFFRNIPAPLREGGRVYISHAHWFDESYIPQDSTLKLTGKYTDDDFDTTNSGWTGEAHVWPIVELEKCS